MKHPRICPKCKCIEIEDEHVCRTPETTRLLNHFIQQATEAERFFTEDELERHARQLAPSKTVA